MAFDFKNGRSKFPKDYDSPYDNRDSDLEYTQESEPVFDSQKSFYSGGFRDKPEIRKSPDYPTDSLESDFLRYSSGRRTSKKFTNGRDILTAIPWKIIIMILGIMIVIGVCWTYREAITEFLIQVLTWVIIIIIIMFLLKWIIFRRRR